MKLKFNGFLVLLLVLVAQLTFAQERAVSGTVSDNAGMPLPGVSVLVKGTKNGTQSDFDGKFTIKVSPSQVLVFSYIGMKAQELKATSSTMKVKLMDDSQILEEVVITGALGIKKKKDAITSSQQLVTSKELTQAANPNIVRSLTGKVSGLQIDNTSGGVNGTTRIVLRGPRSISGNTEALVVIDNSISTATILQQLPPEVIENVNVIKGAQGSALYGEQGANGVIIVTTKKGSKNEKTSVTINSSIDFEDISFLPTRQKKYGQGWDGEQISYENGGWGALLDGSLVDTGLPQANGETLQLPYSANTDNIKDYYQTGTTYQNGVTMNFGGSDSYALLSANRRETNFIVEGDQLKRNSFLFKAGKTIGKLRVEGNLQYTSSNTNQTNAAGTLEDLLQTASNIPVGLFKNSGAGEGWNAYFRNPFWQRKNDRFERSTDVFNSSVTLEYAINKNISVSYLGNLQNTHTAQESHANAFFDDVNFGGGDLSATSSYYNSKTYSRNYYGDVLLNLNYMLSDDVSFKMNIGHNLQDRLSNTISQGGTNLQIPGWYNIQNVLSPRLPNNLVNNAFRTRRVAYFANADIGYKDYLFLNLTARSEQVSTLDKNNNAYFYPSAGLSFIPTKAFDGLKDGQVLNNVKAYINIARVGNTNPINAYDIENLSALGTGYPFGGLSSYTQLTSTTNPLIKPEFLTTKEVGLNLGFFQNRLTLDATVYQSDISDLISQSTVSSTSGITKYKDNIGKLRNRGIELDLGFMPIKTKDFVWEGRVSYTSYDTKVTDLGGTDELNLYDITKDENINAGIYAVKGESFPMIKGTTYQRDDLGRVIIGADGMPLVNTTQSNLGKVTPDYIIGFNNSFSYKGLKLAAVLDYRTGGSIISGTKYNLAWSGHLEESADFDRDAGFIYPNSVINTGTAANPIYTPNTTVVSAAGYGGTGVINYYSQYSRVGENSLLDATAFKVRELSLSYSFPSKLLQKTGITALNFGINARNPFMIVSKGNKGYTDPEASNTYSASSSNSALRNVVSDNTASNGQGYSQVGQYPSTKTYGFSLNLTF
jgi:TonB-linked SusC/RagA family outer membrane protein